jgi:phosphosulfolactate phosphohydrolase-like enzyme
MKPSFLLPFVVLLQLLNSSSVLAQWPLNGAAICTAPDDQSSTTIVSDGVGGAILAWTDVRNGVDSNIYAQRINASGLVQWTSNGVGVCTSALSQSNSSIVSDGAGGAIIVWADYRNGPTDVYAQRINASGVVQWTGDGVAICNVANSQDSPEVVSDGAGGAIVTWYDNRNGTNYDIYAQHVNAAGVMQWTSNGVSLCGAANNQVATTIASDGSNGAIVAWYDYRSGTNYDVYAQRVNASGIVQWTANGVALCTAAADQQLPRIVSDGAGGAIVAWADYRSSFGDIYAQRIGTSGTAQWTANGVALCTAANQQSDARIVSDEAGGAIVSWWDFRVPDGDIYSQRINGSGVVQWAPNGVGLCTKTGGQSAVVMVSDGDGGAIAAWMDYRNGPSDIYAQRINAAGIIQWTSDGVVVCTAANGQYGPQISAIEPAGALVTWMDPRNGATYDIYAQRVEMNLGGWGHPEPTIISVKDIPHDQGGHVMVAWTASDHDISPLQEITHYTLWRELDAGSFSSSAREDAFVNPARLDPGFVGVAYRRVPGPSGPTTWEYSRHDTRPACHQVWFQHADTGRFDGE